MELTISGAELLVGEEERVVEEGERVEDVELGLRKFVSFASVEIRKVVLTCLARIRASLTSKFKRVLRTSSSSLCCSKALSEA